jgi:hypothetical protein
MSETKLLPCPICGGNVDVALMGSDIEWWSITRGKGKDRCKCRLFMESSCFSSDESQEYKEAAKQRMIECWNTRKPMERIVERLEQVAKDYADSSDEYGQGKYFSYSNAAEIVKKEGGLC